MFTAAMGQHVKIQWGGTERVVGMIILDKNNIRSGEY